LLIAPLGLQLAAVDIDPAPLGAKLGVTPVDIGLAPLAANLTVTALDIGLAPLGANLGVAALGLDLPAIDTLPAAFGPRGRPLPLNAGPTFNLGRPLDAALRPFGALDPLERTLPLSALDAALRSLGTLRALGALDASLRPLSALDAALRPLGALEAALWPLGTLDAALWPLGALDTALLLALGALLLRRLRTDLAAVATAIRLLGRRGLIATPVASVAPITALSVSWDRHGHDSRTGQKHQFAHFKLQSRSARKGPQAGASGRGSVIGTEVGSGREAPLNGPCRHMNKRGFARRTRAIQR
jgi:hypothetical protein